MSVCEIVHNPNVCGAQKQLRDKRLCVFASASTRSICLFVAEKE